MVARATRTPPMDATTEYERRHWDRGVCAVAGIDEVGRGCLAGPVVAAAVIFPPYALLAGVRDSKQLSPLQREGLVPQIQSLAVAWGIGLMAPHEIDAINILEATKQAMAMAVARLAVPPQHLLIDGREAVPSAISQECIIKGDQRSLSIAAASIVAKVFRDRLMADWEASFPQFSFGRHKGYGTRQHLEELRQYGPTPLHRRSFSPVRERAVRETGAEGTVNAGER